MMERGYGCLDIKLLSVPYRRIDRRSGFFAYHVVLWISIYSFKGSLMGTVEETRTSVKSTLACLWRS